jgi:hypothetical protein
VVTGSYQESQTVQHLTKANSVPNAFYRPEQRHCPVCHSVLKRDHIVWDKRITFSTGVKRVVSWAYRCQLAGCSNSTTLYRSHEVERLHLKHRRFSRELVVRVGHQRFWQHQTREEMHTWLTQDLKLNISEREVGNLIADFLALLRAAQPAKIRRKLSGLKGLVIGVDGTQPEKGNDNLYIIRELQCGVTLLAENLEESSHDALIQFLFDPLKALADELGLSWQGVVSDAQESIHLAVTQSLPGVPYQACQSHCLRDAGELTFEADRAMKKELKKAFRQSLARLRKRMQAVPEDDLFRVVLLEYASALRSTLLIGGVAPFDLGGLRVYEALENVEASLLRCQKKAITGFCVVSSLSRNVV